MIKISQIQPPGLDYLQSLINYFLFQEVHKSSTFHVKSPTIFWMMLLKTNKPTRKPSLKVAPNTLAKQLHNR